MDTRARARVKRKTSRLCLLGARPPGSQPPSDVIDVFREILLERLYARGSVACQEKSLPEDLFSRVSRVSRRFGRETRRKAARLPRARRLPARVCGHPSALAVLMPASGASGDMSPNHRGPLAHPAGDLRRGASGRPGHRAAPAPRRGARARWLLLLMALALGHAAGAGELRVPRRESSPHEHFPFHPGRTLLGAGTFGAPLRGLSPDELRRFSVGRTAFEGVEGVADGLGPVFNGTSCAGCHDLGATGGGSELVETPFGTSPTGSSTRSPGSGDR